MNHHQTMLELIGLGSIAGVLPVFLGIAAALLMNRVLPRPLEGMLIGIAIGVLVYLFFDLMHEAVELTGVRDVASWSVFLGSLFLSFVGLIALEQAALFSDRPMSRALSLPYMIAVGMGLHNLGEGLAIGASYANGEWVLGGLLIAGFALHNGTEGFGIVGSAGRSSLRPRDVLVLGLLAGAPTCVGTVMSGYDVSVYLSVACYTLAAGSLLYVIVSLIPISYTASRRIQTGIGLFLGISLMYLTGMLLRLFPGLST